MPVAILAHLFRKSAPCTIEAALPSALLASVVERYIWYTHEGDAAKIWATADGQPALLFVLDAPYHISFTGRYQLNFSYAFCCTGTLQNTYISNLPAGTRLLVVKFTTDGLALLLRQRLAAIAPTPLIPITGIWKHEGLPLAMAICKAGTPAIQVRLLEDFLQQLLPVHSSANYLLERAITLIKTCKGQTNVQALCATLKVNYKWLERHFKHALGIPPKTYISNLRFLHAYFDVQENTAALTHIALENGYYDQNHFIKAFRQHTGQVPSDKINKYA
ncbi:helix-turn-helix domain-containing protein [Chitinophaga defluvii]|uniref:Helix-turn-helix domain-containing protein n=1 Tax=Chitinophaga defluvii TaxID=3163343 RepID=A0ABV2T9L0_9BACT